jgi:hypothetical protein
MSLCCINCFDDKHLIDFIKENGKRGSCDFCGKNNTKCIAPDDLAEIFLPVINLYSIVEDFMPMHDLKEWDGDFIWTKLDEDWGIFKIGYEKQEELLRDMFPCKDPKEGDPQYLHSYVEMEDDYWGADLEITDALIKEWDNFCNEVKYRNRFFPKELLNLGLLEELLLYFAIRIQKRTHLYRARTSDRKIFPSKMGKPPIEKSTHGRANPKGIPYLYLASDAKTAATEIRPNVHEKVTMGKFKILSPLNIVDLRNPNIGSPFGYSYDLKFILEHIGFLRKLGIEISKPIDPKDTELEYLPLQYLCEFIKNQGFDGVAYKSSVGPGYNLAIFNDGKVKCINTDLYDINISLERSKR